MKTFVSFLRGEKRDTTPVVLCLCRGAINGLNLGFLKISPGFSVSICYHAKDLIIHCLSDMNE